MLLWSSPRSREGLAGLVVLKYIACPYCGAVYKVLTLGLMVRRVERSRDGSAAERFRNTHIANPVACPSCGGEFIVFVGVDYDFMRRTARDVHVVVARSDEDWVENLVNWPYRGIVHGGVIEFDGVSIYYYESLEEYNNYNGERIVEAGSLDTGATNTTSHQ